MLTYQLEVYENGKDEIVILQESAEDHDYDDTVIITKAQVPILIKALKDIIKEGK